MFKRTNGYVLLTLLVLTGMAGRVTNETLHSKERRLLITSLKDTRADLLATVKDLSDRQLDYRPRKSAPSIRELLADIVAAEKAYSLQAHTALSAPTGRDRAARVSDEERAAQLAHYCPVLGKGHGATPSLKNAERALEQYKEDRARAIKYIRTTTQDVRAYTAPTAAGPADVYQLYLALCAHQAGHNQQIREIVQSAGFPKE
jgi:hypothetical protein